MNSRVLVVESHPITRWGLGRLVEDQDDLTVVGSTGPADEALALTSRLRPDVVTIGLGAPDAHGLPLAKHLRDRVDDLGLVVLAEAEHDDVLLQAFETGVSAFVSKSAPVAEVLGAVRHASVSASSFTASGLAAALRRRRDAGSALDQSPRERQVLDLLVDGRSVPALAASLHISPSTAKTYVSRLYEKPGARNRAEAVMAADRLGLTGPVPATASYSLAGGRVPGW